MFSSSMRKQGLAVAGVCAVLLFGSACSDSQASGTSQSTGKPGASTTPGGATPSNDPAAAKVTVTPAKGAAAVRPDKPVTVATTSGVLQDVTLRDSKGGKVTGTFNSQKSQWTSAPQLKPGASYTVSGTAQGSDGKSVPISSTFHTLTASTSLKASVAPLNGETVGVGMPIQIYWSHSVKDQAAVEKRLSVTTSVPVEGTWPGRQRRWQRLGVHQPHHPLHHQQGGADQRRREEAPDGGPGR
jgi:hypothetical protein